MSDDYRVLITGSREWSNRTIMQDALREIRVRADGKRMVIIQGEARGADRMAKGFAMRSDNADYEGYPANWGSRSAGTYRPDAGLKRNQEMVDTGADVCVAFLIREYENVGTRDCMKRAADAGIEVVEVWNE